MPTYNDATFRAMFPEFGDTNQYPAAVIEVWWGIACSFIQIPSSGCSMLSGAQQTAALNYMTAHLYILSLRAADATSPEADQGGVEISATIDKVSVSTMPPPADDMWSYWLAQTPKGQALQALLQVASVGGLMVGGRPEGNAFRRVYGVFPR